MAQPFNYMIPSPQDAFQSSFAFGQQIAAQQKAQQQAQQKAMEAQQARAAMQMVYDNPTPENISKFYMAYPAYKEQFEAARQPLTDAAKADDLDFTSRALSLLTNGATDQANALMQSRIAALKETPGREAEAARTEAVAQMIAKEPQAGKALLNMKMAAIDSKLYETLFGKPELTTDEKRYEAIRRMNGPAAADAWWNSQITKEKLVIIPGRGAYRAEDFAGADPENLPRPKSAAERDALPDGKKYIAPNGEVRTKEPSPLSGIPAPTLDASGKPLRLTRAQYAGLVQIKGKAKADKYLQANNITVSD
jgi:hypothetical protein